jgi:hypothetical protein
MNHGEIVSFIWGVTDLIRDTFKRGKYRDVILPLTVLRRLDCAGTSGGRAADRHGIGVGWRATLRQHGREKEHSRWNTSSNRRPIPLGCL